MKKKKGLRHLSNVPAPHVVSGRVNICVRSVRNSQKEMLSTQNLCHISSVSLLASQVVMAYQIMR